MEDILLTIHDNNRNQLGTLNFITNLVYKEVYGGISEITFNAPFKIVDSRTHLQVDNPQIPNLVFMYLVKHQEIWFIIDSVSTVSDSNSTYLKVSAKELGYELKYKQVLYTSGVPENPAKDLRTTVNEMLVQCNSNWTVGYVDGTLLLDTDGITPKNRAIDVSTNMLDALLNNIIVFSAWNAVIDFDSENLLINFHNYATDGIDLNLHMSDENYIKSVNWDYSLDVLISKLNIYGKDKFPIGSVSPNGKSYITDFSYFKQIRYMSQDLITALNNYESILTIPVDDIKTETKTISSNSVTLHRPLLISEKITVDYNGTLLSETTETPTQTQYKLNYATGVVTLNSFYNGKSVDCTYDWAYAVLISQKTKLETDKLALENTLNNLPISELMVETLTVSSQNVTLKRIPSIADKVTITEDNSDPVVTYTEIFVESPLINQYKVDYNTGEIAFNVLNNSKVLYIEYVGIGLTELQNLVDTSITLNVFHDDLDSQLVFLKAFQTTQTANLATQNTLISANQTELDTLLSNISITNYLTSDQITKLNELTIEATYDDSEITSQSLEPKYLKQLLAEGIKQLKMRNAPRYSLTLDIVDFISATNVSETEKDKLKIGTIVGVKHSTTGIDVTCKIVEINYDYQNYKINIKIANEKDIKDGFTKFADLLTKNNVTSSYVATPTTGITITPFVSGVNNSGLLLGRVSNLMQDQIGAVQTSADGKNTIHYSIDQPLTVGAKIGDTWFDTNDGNAIYKWTGTGWSIVQFGTNAIANLTITNALIADATIQNAKIGNLDAGKITTGFLSSARIEALSITADKLESNIGTGLDISSNTSIALMVTGGVLDGNKLVSSINLQPNTIKIRSENIEISGSTIDISANTSITSKVSANGIISAINQTAEIITIAANNISLEGLITANSYFKILANGSMQATNGIFSGTISNGAFSVTQAGAVTASNMNISGGSITGGTISIGSGFSVSSVGAVTASNLSITGGTISGSTLTLGGAGNAKGTMTFLNDGGTTAGIIDNKGINLNTGTYSVGAGVNQSRLWGGGITLGNEAGWTQINSNSQVQWLTNGYGIDIRGILSTPAISISLGGGEIDSGLRRPGGIAALDICQWEGYWRFVKSGYGTVTATIDDAGMHAPAFVNSSDRDLKENISDLNTSYSYQTIKNMKAYMYNYKNPIIPDKAIPDGEKPIETLKFNKLSIGIMADEAPLEVVEQEKEKGIDLYKFATLTMSALQEAIKKIELLESKLGGIS